MRENKYVLIAGCRDYNNYTEAKCYINRCIAEIRKRYKITVISGGARGTDNLGELYAIENGFDVKKYLPDWERYGKSAGPLRNKIMVDKADFIICFWNGKSRGTASTVKYAIKTGKPLRIKYI